MTSLVELNNPKANECRYLTKLVIAQKTFFFELALTWSWPSRPFFWYWTQDVNRQIVLNGLARLDQMRSSKSLIWLRLLFRKHCCDVIHFILVQKFSWYSQNNSKWQIIEFLGPFIKCLSFEPTPTKPVQWSDL